jgi:hypothetical protein
LRKPPHLEVFDMGEGIRDIEGYGGAWPDSWLDGWGDV